MCLKWFEKTKNGIFGFPKFERNFEKNKDWATLSLRIVLAILFITKGLPKLQGLEGTTGFFAGIGIPLAAFFAVVVGIVELVGGIALLLGLFTRYVATLQAIVMIVAILTVHLNGTYHLALIALGGLIALIFLGAGPLSLDRKLFKN